MHISLQTRVTALVVLSVTAIVVGKGAFDLYSSTTERETAMAYHLQMVTAMEAKALARPLWDYNVDQVASILAGLAREERTFLRGTVTGADGKVVATDTAPTGTAAKTQGGGEDGRTGDKAWSLEVPSIVEDGGRRETVGTLHVTYSRRALDDAWWRQVMQSLETTAATTVVTLVAVLLSLRLLLRPLGGLTTAMRRLAAGDTLVSVPATGRHDEIGDMARTVDVFKQNMITSSQLAAEQAAARAARSRRQDAMERDTEAFGTSVSAVMTRLGASAEAMRGAAEAMTRASATVHQAATNTSDGAARSSRDLATTADSVEQLTSSFAEISRQVDTAAAVSRDAVRRAEANQVTIRGLAESTERIGAVVKLINDIAGQTNLLALNATIEAARAGDAGKGFAVVASEVKALAAQTARATAEIGGQIQAARGVTEATIAAMREIGDMIGRMDAVSHAMTKAVEQQSVTTREIAERVKGVSEATAQSAQAMGEVVSVAGETGSASREVLAGADDIGQVAGVLRAEVERFLLMVRTDSGERRRFERFVANGLKVRLRMPGKDTVRVVVTDLSEGGAALRTDQPIELGTDLSCELTDGVTVPAKVIRVGSGGVIAVAFRDDEAVRLQVRRAMAESPLAAALQHQAPANTEPQPRRVAA